MYTSSNIMLVMKSRGIRLVVASGTCVGVERCTQGFGGET